MSIVENQEAALTHGEITQPVLKELQRAGVVTHQALMTESEFCKIVGISRVTAWRLREAGKLPHIRVGSKILYRSQHIEEFLAAHEVGIKEPRRARVRVKGNK